MDIRTFNWLLEHLVSRKAFYQKNDYNPIDKLQSDIEQIWGGEEAKQVRFPLLLRIGRIMK